MDATASFIVAGVDGSRGGHQALTWAVDEAVRRGCGLRVVTAWTWDGIETMGAASNPSAALEQARRTQEDALARVLGAAETGPPVERLLPMDSPSDALCGAAQDAELIVLGSHGHGVVHDRLVGSTTQRVLHHAPCPVVVMPAPPRVAETRGGNASRGRQSA